MFRKTDPHLVGIRQLCSIGLPIQSLASELAAELAAYLPCGHVSFQLPDELGRPIRIIHARGPMPDMAALEVIRNTPFILEIERQSLDMGTLDFFRSGRPFQNNASYLSRFAGTPLYQYVLRPMDVHVGLRLAVRDGERLVGGVFFGRPRGDPPFSERDEQRLAAVVPYLSLAMAWPAAESAMNEHGGLEGLIVADRRGRVQHLCPVAAQMRFMIVHPFTTDMAAQEALWQTKIAGLVAATLAIAAGNPAPPPGWKHRNNWGRFELHAFPLNPEPGGESLVAIRIRRYQPEAVPLVRGLTAVGLTSRQRDVALLLARGIENRDIATRLNLRPHTVADMIKEIYARAGVRSRQELRARLLVPSAA